MGIPSDPGKHFNSRPHGGRRNESLVSELVCISTHALTEGDHHLEVLKFRLSISTHALTEGDGME